MGFSPSSSACPLVFFWFSSCLGSRICDFMGVAANITKRLSHYHSKLPDPLAQVLLSVYVLYILENSDFLFLTMSLTGSPSRYPFFPPFLPLHLPPFLLSKFFYSLGIKPRVARQVLYL